jgi:hypothetical protein
MLQSYWESAPSEERNEIVRASFAVALLAVLFLVLAFAPARDPSQVAAGIPCSILSERQIGAVFGAPMRLRPTDGTVCQYVSIDPDKQGMLFVIARHDGTQGSLGRVLDHRLSLRYDGRIYTLIAVAGVAHANVAEGQERRLALMLDRRVAKRNSASH